MKGASVAVLLAIGLVSSSAHSATLQGHVTDSHGVSVAGATVLVELKTNDNAESKTVHSDAKGGYKFSSLAAGSYTIRAEMSSVGDATFGPFQLRESEAKNIDLVLKPSATSFAFYDEFKFTVAGVTDHDYVGGHGSDTVKRSAEALTQATASLSKEPPKVPGSSAQTEKSLREVVERDPHNFAANDRLGALLLSEENYRESLIYLKQALQLDPGNARVHHLLASADESLGDPLAAVHEYERTAELEPTETNLFDWGTELLLHQAIEPAIAVFSKGIYLFPLSSRMLLGAGTALYARGDYSQAAQRFFEGTDLDPGDPGPYMFLGTVRTPQITELQGFIDRMARFAKLQPRNAWANYFYAASLWTQRKETNDRQTTARVQSLLEKAVRLDSTLGAAYLQLGILQADEHDFPTAIRYYKKAIQINPQMEQAHYQLAQVYRQTGEAQKAQVENGLFQQLSKTSAERLARERSELQRFVVTLKSPAPN